MQSIWNSYYAECHAVIFMVDSTDSARIDECRQVLDRVVSNSDNGSVPVLMLANKQDMPMAMQVHQIKQIFNQIAERLSARESTVLAVSALKGVGVREAVDWLHSRVLRNAKDRPPVYNN